MVEQRQLLNKILQTKDFKIISDHDLSDKYFSAYTAEFNYIKEYYEKYNCIPAKDTFEKIFPEFPMATQPVDAPTDYLLEQIYDNYYREYASEQYNQLRTILESGKQDAGIQALDTMQAIGEEVNKIKVNLQETYIDLTEDISRYDRYKERTLNADNSYVSTGFPELDELTGGIDRVNEDMVIAAKTGVGKSWILFKMATAAYEAGLRVGIYSGEMHEDKVGYRLDTILGGISNKALNRGISSEESDYVKYLAKLKNNELVDGGKKGHIFVQTPSMLRKDDGATVADLKKFIEDAQLDILFVDQYSLLNDTSKGNKQQYEQVGNISKGIKNLQVSKHIPIIAVSQLHRDGKKKDDVEDESDTQDSESIALAYRISQDATTIILLSKKPIDPDSGEPVKKMEHGKHYRQFLFTLNVTKARDGGEGKVDYAIDLDTFDCTYFDKKSKNLRSDDASDSSEYMTDTEDDDYEEDTGEYMRPIRN